MVDDIFAMIPNSTEYPRLWEDRIIWQAPRLLTFEEYIDEFEGVKHHLELVGGVPVERMPHYMAHEELRLSLLCEMSLIAEELYPGIVLGGRTAVMIDEFGGRLPDILFVKHDNSDRVNQRAVYGPPDLIVEIQSQFDRPNDLIQLERDYRSIRVQEILFLNPSGSEVRALRNRHAGYEETVVRSGYVRSEVLPDLVLDVTRLVDKSRKTIDRISQLPFRSDRQT